MESVTCGYLMKKMIALNIFLSVLVLFANTGCHISTADEEHVVGNIVKTYSVNAGGSLTIVSSSVRLMSKPQNGIRSRLSSQRQ